MNDGRRRTALSRYKGYGLIAGFAVGLLVGVMVSGSHFREWPLWQTLLAVFGGGGLGAIRAIWHWRLLWARWLVAPAVLASAVVKEVTLAIQAAPV